MNIKVTFLHYTDKSFKHRHAYMTHIPRVGEHVDFGNSKPLLKVASVTHNLEVGVVVVGLIDGDS